jgi:hypothetical protein
VIVHSDELVAGDVYVLSMTVGEHGIVRRALDRFVAAQSFAEAIIETFRDMARARSPALIVGRWMA